MKRILFVSVIVILISTFILFTFPFKTSASGSKPGYLESTNTYFNYNYYYVSSDFIYPTGLTGVNHSLYGFHPFIIGMDDRYVFIFAKEYTYNLSEGLITLNLIDCFSVTSNVIGLFDVSTVTVPSSLYTLSYFYSVDELLPSIVRDQFGNSIALIYLSIFEDITAQTGLTCYNNFTFPLYTKEQYDLEANGPVSSDESIIYSQVFSYDNFSYVPEGYSYNEDEFAGAIDFEAALSNLDDGIDSGKNGFHALFDRLTSVFHIGPIIFILLTVSFAFFVLGRL